MNCYRMDTLDDIGVMDPEETGIPVKGSKQGMEI